MSACAPLGSSSLMGGNYTQDARRVLRAARGGEVI
jgi:hypothetical protein